MINSMSGLNTDQRSINFERTGNKMCLAGEHWTAVLKRIASVLVVLWQVEFDPDSQHVRVQRSRNLVGIIKQRDFARKLNQSSILNDTRRLIAASDFRPVGQSTAILAWKRLGLRIIIVIVKFTLEIITRSLHGHNKRPLVKQRRRGGGTSAFL